MRKQQMELSKMSSRGWVGVCGALGVQHLEGKRHPLLGCTSLEFSPLNKLGTYVKCLTEALQPGSAVR